ncbi:MAG TPA: N-acetylmuramoyl-L-alanine amidase [Thermotogota bacterium]|nr:N-acetylmuramoyl-L-alanine amidase [Thermotogota bacterium]
MKIIYKNSVTNKYVRKTSVKSRIILTDILSNNYTSAVTTINKFKNIVPHYLIDKSGKVYNIISDKYYTYAIGLKFSELENSKNIVIGLINEGPLYLINDKYYWYNKKIQYDGQFIFEYNYFNFDYWAPYTRKQFISTILLLSELCSSYSISKEVIIELKYDKNFINKECIMSSKNLIEDNFSTNPSFNLKTLNSILNSNYDLSQLELDKINNELLNIRSY